jgi:hypothetical protein
MGKVFDPERISHFVCGGGGQRFLRPTDVAGLLTREARGERPCDQTGPLPGESVSFFRVPPNVSKWEM